MENKEVSIRIQDIIASFLKSIVWIAVVTAFFGALLGAYGVYKARHTTVNDSYATKITLKENEISDKELTIKNLEKANSTIRDVEIPSMESRIENELVRTKEGKEYIENSIFYSIDPMNCGTAKISFSIDVPVPETVTEDVAAYKDNEMRRAADLCTSACPFSDDVIKEVKKILGTDADLQYVDELIRVTNYKDAYCRLEVFYTDADLAKKAADYLYGELRKIVSGYNSEYTMTILNQTSGYEVNWPIYESHAQTDSKILLAEKNLSVDMDSIDTLNQRIDENNKKLVTARTELETLNKDLSKAKSSKANAEKSQSGKRSLIKYGLVGGFLGFVLACVFVYAKYLLGGKIRNRNSITSRYSYPLIGVVPSKKKYLFGKTIKRLEGDPVYAEGDIISAIAANTQAIAEINGATSNCMVGSIEGNDPALTSLKEALNNKVAYAGNILSEAKAVKALDKYTHVILVEKRNESQLEALADEISKLKSMKKEILGIILL